MILNRTLAALCIIVSTAIFIGQSVQAEESSAFVSQKEHRTHSR